MKYILSLLIMLASTAIFAQTKTTIVSGIETDNSYTFKVKLDRKRNEDLLGAYLKVVNLNAPEKHKTFMEKLEGTATTTTAIGTAITFNTKRSSLRIEAEKGNAESRAEAEQLANVARAELGLEVPEPPAPPAPPKGN